MHTLELWHEPQIQKAPEKRGPLVYGYLITPQHLYYATVVDQYLFLYEVFQADRNTHCFDGLFKRHVTVPQDVIGDLVHVIDLLHVQTLNDHIITNTMRFTTDLNFIKTLTQHLKEFKENKTIKVKHTDVTSMLTIY
jgi:hypothetical protein